MKKLWLLFVLFLSVMMLSSCASSIENSGDELTLNSWQATLSNGAVMTLEFNEDKATLKIKRKDIGAVEISGLCEVSDSAFVIHDRHTNVAYNFLYDVNFDRIEVIYDTNTVLFDKK